MRVLWMSNYTSTSAYAAQARLFVPRLRSAGVDVSVFEIGNGPSMPRLSDDVRIYTTDKDPLGSDKLARLYRALNCDAVISLTDVWGIPPSATETLIWYPFAMVDHKPVPPRVLASLETCQFPIAVTRFGFDQLRQSGHQPYYHPLAVDPAVFAPVPKAQARRAIGLDEQTFFVSFVGVNHDNPSRKGIPELLAAWAIFSARHPQARLYLHTDPTGYYASDPRGGVNIDNIITALAIDRRTILFPDETAVTLGYSQAKLARIAAASDVLVLPSRGEGFGVPLIEFQRCGCPVITTAFGGGAELCASGWLVDYEPTWSWQDAFHAQPIVISLVERIEEAYDARDDERWRRQAIEFARQYDIDDVFARYTAPLVTIMRQRCLLNWGKS